MRSRRGRGGEAEDSDHTVDETRGEGDGPRKGRAVEPTKASAAADRTRRTEDRRSHGRERLRRLEDRACGSRGGRISALEIADTGPWDFIFFGEGVGRFGRGFTAESWEYGGAFP